MAVSGRIYTMSFASTTATLSATQDLLAVYAGSSKIFAVLSVTIGQVTGSSVANQRVRLRYLPTTVTAGSGGSSGVLRPWIPGDAAATITGRTNDTTPATSSGTAYDIWDDQWNIINGFLWVPPLPSRPPIVGINCAFVITLDTAPSSIVTTCSITVEELP